MQARLLLGAALVATFLLYWVGLSGPFLLDDIPNLEPVRDWLNHQTSWQSVLSGNQSGLLGRPVAMASFMLSATMGGLDPFHYKLGNLVVHVACGVLGWLVLRRALANDPRLSAHAELVASIVAALWLLHPLHASTVLYVVQRMAQLGALFVLAAVLAYLVARRQWTAGRRTPALVNLFLVFPVLTLAGVLSKENAAVAPALCLVFELAYLDNGGRPRRLLQAFYGLFLALPLALGLLGFALKPEAALGGYLVRDFTWDERLLSQGRVLVDYIGMLLFPRTPLMGLFADDFPVSTGLLSPATTLLSLLLLATVSAFAIALRRRAPSLFAGWFFFLVAHAMEASFLPLELYFEHRNYLPALGLILAVAGLCTLVPRNVRTNVFSLRQLGLLAAGGFALVFAFATLGIAMLWQHEDTIIGQGVKSHPDSLRANRAMAMLALNTGRYDEGFGALALLAASPNPRNRMVAHVDMVSLACVQGSGANPADLDAAVADAQSKLSVTEQHALEQLAKFSKIGDCGAVGPNMVARAIGRIVDAATAQPDTLQPKWRLRYAAAELFARAGNWPQALPQAERAWQPSADTAAGALLAQAYAKNGMQAEAERTLAQLAERVEPGDSIGQAELAKARELVEARDQEGLTPL